MKVMIIYYSQSGNTQKIARKIRDGLRSADICVTLRFLKDASYEEMKDYDIIGIGCPIWFEMPPNVRKFVEEMPDQNGKPAFLFNTHATMPDLFNPLAVPRMQARGLKVVDWNDWYGSAYTQIFPEPYYTGGHPDEQDLKEAYEWGRKLAGDFEVILSGKPFNYPDTPMPNMSPMHANAAIEHLGGFHNPHGALVRDPEKCLYPKCHICMDNCTMNFIDLASAPAKFGNCGNKCDDTHGCTFCEMLCPTGAIRPVIPYEIAAPAGVDHDIPLFNMVLSKAESEGKFRRLVPADEVGTRTPFYTVYSGHPRMKALKFDENK